MIFKFSCQYYMLKDEWQELYFWDFFKCIITLLCLMNSNISFTLWTLMHNNYLVHFRHLNLLFKIPWLLILFRIKKFPLSTSGCVESSPSVAIEILHCRKSGYKNSEICNVGPHFDDQQTRLYFVTNFLSQWMTKEREWSQNKSVARKNFSH